VYFVANGVLASNANSQGAHSSVGNCSATHQEATTCNLYLLRESESESPSVTFVATLSGKDDELYPSTVGNHTGGDWRPDLGERLAEVTPDGATLVFESIASPTGYSSDAPEVFVYDAGDGQLACASCSPADNPPVVNSFPQIEERGSYHSKLPVSTPAKTYTNDLVSESGARVFFESSQPLVPQDKNGVQDVYEWERVASPAEPDNTCTTQSASRVTGGCTFLISSGIGNVDSFLVGADAEGRITRTG
jgi:hypothetical protein